MSTTTSKSIPVPATTMAPAATVELAPNGEVTLDGEYIGTIGRGEYQVSPRAAGHSGRIVRYHASHPEWIATAANGREFRGGDWKQSRRKNSRLAAVAFLLSARNGGDDYFYWA